MRPHEALEMQTRLREAMSNSRVWEKGMDEFLASMDARQYAGRETRTADLTEKQLARWRGQGELWVLTEETLLSKATTFIVEAPMNPLIRRAAHDLPDGFVVEEHMIPSQYGFLVFDEPWGQLDVDSKLMRSRAVTWRVGQVASPDTGEISDHRAVIVHEYTQLRDLTDEFNQELSDRYGKVSYSQMEKMFGGMQVQHRLVIILGQPMDQGISDIPSTWTERELQSAVGPMRAIIALWNLMGQKITTEEKTEFSPRNVKRWERKQTNPDVRVINLRRRSLSPTGEHETRTVDWRGQWPVRGHWHPYRVGPGRQEIRHVYVSDYLKGPADKPIIESTKVYRLTR